MIGIKPNFNTNRFVFLARCAIYAITDTPIGVLFLGQLDPPATSM